jgi:ADP-ribose pyrophosphatase YjhB (NUDIX family)
MDNIHPPRWLEWAREIQALAQSGRHYAENDYQRERFDRLTEIAAEIVSEYSKLEYPTLVDAFRAPIGYATPHVDVRAVVFRDTKLLMVRERLDNNWTLPGGWVDVGNIPSQAAERETLEEAGYVVKARKIIGVYDGNRVAPLELFHAIKLVYLCELIGGDARPSRETSEVAFFGKNEIPVVFSGERTKLRHIDDAFVTLDNPNAPTVVD